MVLSDIVDIDKLVREVHPRVFKAILAWLRGKPETEEPLLNHLTGNLKFKTRSCDLGVRGSLTVTQTIHVLHRRDWHNRDLFGSDLALTITATDGQATAMKTAVFQLKITECSSGQLELAQLSSACRTPLTARRSFVAGIDKAYRIIRLAKAEEAYLQILAPRRDHMAVNTLSASPLEWIALAPWLDKWLKCEWGEETDHANPVFEKILERAVESRPQNADALAKMAEDLPIPRVWMRVEFGQPTEVVEAEEETDEQE